MFIHVARWIICLMKGTINSNDNGFLFFLVYIRCQAWRNGPFRMWALRNNALLRRTFLFHILQRSPTSPCPAAMRSGAPFQTTTSRKSAWPIYASTTNAQVFFDTCEGDNLKNLLLWCYMIQTGSLFHSRSPNLTLAPKLISRYFSFGWHQEGHPALKTQLQQSPWNRD